MLTIKKLYCRWFKDNMAFWTAIAFILVFYFEPAKAFMAVKNPRFFFVFIERAMFQMCFNSLVILEPTITEVAFFHI